MPYTAEHKQETRTRIIKSARRLFNRNGFADVTIGEIMSDAGLTHGGFYKHFSAKEDLYSAAVLEFIRSDEPEPWQKKHIDPKAKGPDLARMILDAYLSKDHYKDREASCPMIALPSDVARNNVSVKKAFREVMEMMVGRLCRQPASRRSDRHASARWRWWRWPSAAWCWRGRSTTSRFRTRSATAPCGRHTIRQDGRRQRSQSERARNRYRRPG